VRTLAALKVKLILEPTNPAGRMGYPDFSQLQAVKDAGVPWVKYIDTHTSGWKYEMTGMLDDDPESPFGEQYALLFAPEDFVTQAVATFPSRCVKLPEADAQTWYETKYAPQLPAKLIDRDVVEAIQAKTAAGLALDADDTAALDEADPTPGIRANPSKRFASMKTAKGISFVR